MPVANPWTDPSNLIALGGVALGLLGFLFGILSFFWNRRENRLDALRHVLEPMVRAAQNLKLANDRRRTADQLRQSFPDPKLAPESVDRINKSVQEYNGLMEKFFENFRTAEAELAARSFRFPGRIARAASKTQERLSEYGQLVNAGKCDQAELLFAKFRDDYTTITRYARGWRLNDPIEGCRQWLKRKRQESEVEDRYDLTPEEMNGIMELVEKRATTQSQKNFAVHPPKKLLDNPELAKSDNVINELEDSVFVVVFQDGTSKMLSFVELMVFTYNLVFLKLQWDELNTMVSAARPAGNRHYEITLQFAVNDIMRSEMVKLLLEKITFENTPSDA
ncbi:MAG: hypothetical protein K8T91_22995 [Planctomycetes bacterium]|nr:hypothetical protein [Planctomycetota bacterium]